MNRIRKIISELRFKHYLTATFVCLLLLISQTESSAQSDTVDVGRQYDLDTIKFLNTYQKNVSLLHSDTLLVQIESKFYRIPYKVTLKSVDVADNTPKRFAISSLALRDYPDFSRRLKNIFDNPRERLYTYYSPKDWRFSEEYDRYFRQYDENRSATVSEQTDEGLLGDETTGKSSSIDKIDFPLPATIDIEVNLEKDPGLVRILDVDFNFNKLDPEMKSFLVNFRDTRGKSGNRNNLD